MDCTGPSPLWVVVPLNPITTRFQQARLRRRRTQTAASRPLIPHRLTEMGAYDHIWTMISYSRSPEL